MNSQLKNATSHLPLAHQQAILEALNRLQDRWFGVDLGLRAEGEVTIMLCPAYLAEQASIREPQGDLPWWIQVLEGLKNELDSEEQRLLVVSEYNREALRLLGNIG